MRTEEFDYVLPPELIATHPSAKREESRLMVLNRQTGGVEHRRFRDLPEFLRAGDCLVLNDTRVIPARLLGKRATGGKAEILLLHPEPEGRWRALVKPGRKLPAGSVVRVGDADDEEGTAVYLEQELSEGERLVRIETSMSIDNFLERYGTTPLPPYIVAARKSHDRLAKKKGDRDQDEEAEQAFKPMFSAESKEDRERYQTVYAKWSGSVAAPTAGLHFTEDLLAALAKKGVEIRRVTLHIGPGTFAPVKTDDPREHHLHREPFTFREEDTRAINAAIEDPARRVVAVGTTVVRALESCMMTNGRITAGDSSTDLMILPGDEFRAVDALITNFHLPRSTLLMLVCAFAGKENVLAAYRLATQGKYRFYSYGDAMLII